MNRTVLLKESVHVVKFPASDTPYIIGVTYCNKNFAIRDYDNVSGLGVHPSLQLGKVTCAACVRSLTAEIHAFERNNIKITPRIAVLRELLTNTLGIYDQEKSSTMLDKSYPLYVFVMGDQKAYLHQGNASTPEEALEQFEHIANGTPVSVLEITKCNMFKPGLVEVAGPFCPACGATDTDYDPDNCTCAR